MIPNHPLVWLLVFARVSAMLAVFPVFSAQNMPVQVRIALGAMIAWLVALGVPVVATPRSLAGVVWLLAVEIAVGLLLGFISRLLFYGLEMAGSVLSAEMGLSLTAEFNPLSSVRSDVPSAVLTVLGMTLFLSLDLHHWLLVGFQRSYALLPIGGGHLSTALLHDVIGRTAQLFTLALQIAAPVIAVSFLVSLVFTVLGRAVPQMNVFAESFAFRTLAGLAVFGLSLSLMAQHIVNYLRRLPADVAVVAQLLGAR